MDHIIEINRRTGFSLGEARELMPVVFRITKAYYQKVEVLVGRLETLSGDSGDLTLSIEQQVNDLISEWQNKIQRLGALPKGLWIADFDSGDGYFCWKYPEKTIEYWHKYNDGFSKRVRVEDRHEAQAKEQKLNLATLQLKKIEPSISLALPALEIKE